MLVAVRVGMLIESTTVSLSVENFFLELCGLGSVCVLGAEDVSGRDCASVWRGSKVLFLCCCKTPFMLL